MIERSLVRAGPRCRADGGVGFNRHNGEMTMDWEDEKILINAAAAALAEGDLDGYEALKAANRDYAWGPFDRRKAILEGKTIEDLGPDPIWHQMGYYGATTTRVLDKDKL